MGFDIDAIAAAQGIKLSEDHIKAKKINALNQKLVMLWTLASMTCDKCGMMKRFGRSGPTKEFDNGAERDKWFAAKAAGQLPPAVIVRGPPARFIKMPNPNYGRPYYMCSRTKEEGDACKGSYKPWDSQIGPFLADPRLSMFTWMLGKQDETTGAMDYNVFPANYDEIMALPDEYVRAIFGETSTPAQ